MRITFDGVQTNHPAEQMTIKHSAAQSDRLSVNRGFALDISGKVMDNNAYEGHGKTAEEVMQKMGAIDVSLMRDYLTVMSNSMSAEDFQKMSKDGFDPSAMDPADTVTIMDHIKAALIKGGTVVEGFTTDVDEEALRDITGSDSFARKMAAELKKADVPCDEKQAEELGKAYKKAKAIKEPEEASVKYMVENHVAPTIDGLYQAEFSAAGDGSRQGRGFYADEVSGYYSRKAENVDLKALEPQMVKTIEEAGLEVDEDTLKEAGWLIEKGIPLTAENLDLLHEIENIEYPLEDEVIAKALAAAVADGKEAGKANLSDTETYLEKAECINEVVQDLAPEDASLVVADGKELTIRNLQQASVKRSQETEVSKDFVSESGTDKELRARMVLARTQLIMTTQANLKLLESGFSLETQNLEKLVEHLEQAIETIHERLYNTTNAEEAGEREALFYETNQVIKDIPFMPIDVLGVVGNEENPVTLQRVHEEGILIRERYENASGSYETMMTAPRADLGDSIKKAFRNVDDILEDLNLPANEFNRRAVRILGYNQMEINEQAVDRVKETDAKLRSLIHKMSPAVTLDVIRAGKNPLTMSVEELDEFVDTLPTKEQKDQQSLGKFLYKLDQKKDITPEEKEACIGIYRLFRQIEKKDDAAVGSLLRDGRELTFANLLSEVRSMKKKGMEYSIDDDFAGVDAKVSEKTIAEQINQAFYYKNIAAQAAESMSPETVLKFMEAEQIHSAADLEGNTSALEQMVNALLQEEEISSDRIRQEEKQFEDQVMDEMRKAATVSAETLDRMLGMDLSLSPQMLLAMEQLTNEHDAWFFRLFKKANDDKENVFAKADSVADAMEQGNEDEIKDAYEALMSDLNEQAKEAAEEAPAYLDLRSMQSSFRQISILTRMADQGQYDVPVTIEGEDALIHLTLKRSEGVKGQLSIFFETEKLGRVAASFHVGTNHSGYVLCEKAEGISFLQEKREAISALVGTGVDILSTEKIKTKDFLDVQKTEGTADIDNTDVTNRQLYQIAGKFLKIMQNKL